MLLELLGIVFSAISHRICVQLKYSNWIFHNINKKNETNFENFLTFSIVHISKRIWYIQVKNGSTFSNTFMAFHCWQQVLVFSHFFLYSFGCKCSKYGSDHCILHCILHLHLKTISIYIIYKKKETKLDYRLCLVLCSSLTLAGAAFNQTRLFFFFLFSLVVIFIEIVQGFTLLVCFVIKAETKLKSDALNKSNSKQIIEDYCSGSINSPLNCK